jgi:orotate phosphoribosyltransferase
MNRDEILSLFEEAGAVLTNGHFIFTSGRHGSEYVNKDMISTRPDILSQLGHELAKQFVDEDIDTVAGPALGAITLTGWVAFHLGKLKGRTIHAVFAERERGLFEFKRDYKKYVAGKKVLAVEDILTTGLSARDFIEAIGRESGHVVALGALCNRGKVSIIDVGNPPKFISLIGVDFPSWAENECPLCATNIKVNTNVGKGKQYLAEKKVA